MKIDSLELDHLLNETHYQFMLDYYDLLGAHPNVVSIVTSLMPKFSELLTIEGKFVDAVKVSFYTEKLAESDHRRDRAVVGFTTAVRSALHHYDPKCLEAARRLEVRIKTFREEIATKTYMDETAAVKVFIDDLEGTFEADVTQLGLTGWVEEMAIAQNDFQTYFTNRASEMADRPEGQLRNIRRQIDTIYRGMTKLIVAQILINGEKGYGHFVKDLNYRIEYVKEHSHHHAKIDIKDAVIATIPDQVYEGKPVIVLPEVSFEGKKLVFAADYEVTYKHNDRVGTASLSVHGKGAYKGSNITRFNIVEPA
ncbi:MAG: DUF6261 family protein [Dysgonamonadaceae bacterium]|jgi:hypothetical protein|nr:DUF6261 family protein [Dysgonamonadaceae bacterium]